MEQLVNRGYKVRVITIGVWFYNSSENKRKLPKIKYISKGNPWVLLKGILSSFETKNIKSGVKSALIANGKPDLIHFSYSALATLYLNEIPKLQKKGIKIIVSCRGTSDNIKPYIVPSRAELLKELFKNIDAVHCVSQEMLNRMVRDFGLNEEKGFVNRPAINFQKFKLSIEKKDHSEKLIVISTGRLEYVKGFIFALLAVKNLIEEGFELEYRIVGYGKEMENLRFYVNRLGIESHVKLLGGKKPEEVVQEVQMSDVYLSSSLSEGISNAVLEAMALGIPVISTDVGGMSEVVKDKITGILINPYSSSEICEAIKLYASNTHLKNEIATNALDLIRKEYHLGRLDNVFDLNYKKLINV
jgi:colanic acid/amylovoran biosynthesis glycosyltransferase